MGSKIVKKSLSDVCHNEMALKWGVLFRFFPVIRSVLTFLTWKGLNAHQYYEFQKFFWSWIFFCNVHSDILFHFWLRFYESPGLCFLGSSMCRLDLRFGLKNCQKISLWWLPQRNGIKMIGIVKVLSFYQECLNIFYLKRVECSSVMWVSKVPFVLNLFLHCLP